jgi:hypothetical protein
MKDGIGAESRPQRQGDFVDNSIITFKIHLLVYLDMDFFGALYNTFSLRIFPKQLEPDLVKFYLH